MSGRVETVEQKPNRLKKSQARQKKEVKISGSSGLINLRNHQWITEKDRPNPFKRW